MVSGEDDFTRELESDRKQALWRAELTDGTVIVQDDGRPGLEPRSAWLRLAAHLKATGLGVRRLWVQFRSNHLHCLPANADGYYFARAVLGAWGADETFQQIVVGHLLGDTLVVHRYQVPELTFVESEFRDPAEAGDRLIRNPSRGQQLADRPGGLRLVP